jgi:hypothetical protein
MAIATSYAKALHELVSKDTNKGGEYLVNLRTSLEARGHVKLLTKILSEYQKLDIQKSRSDRNAVVTPEKEKVRVLLGLYKKLTEAK